MDFVIIIVVCVKMCRIEKIIVEWRLGGGRKEKKASGPGAVSPCHHTTTTIFPPFGLVWLVSFSPLFSSPLPSPWPHHSRRKLLLLLLLHERDLAKHSLLPAGGISF
jgi:hypothetical protein